MNIVITSVGGFRNRGVEAFVLPTVDQIHQRAADWDITILTPMPDYDSLRLQSPGIKLVKNDFSVGGRPTTVRRLRRVVAALVGKRPRFHYNNANRLIRSASVVVAMGGDVFSSEYGNLKTHLMPLEYAQQHGVPVLFLAHSIGPFRTRDEADSWLRVARRSSLITVRESLTYEYVTGELGVSSGIVHLTADPAFLLAPPPAETVKRLLTYYGVREDRPVVALAISRGISQFAGVSRDAHFRAWRQVIRMFLEEYEAQLLLIPQVQAAPVDNDDRIIATHLLQSFHYDPSIRLIGADHTASEFKGIIGACDMVIAERMHAAIAGLSSGTCTVVVGYSVKAEGILTDLLGAELTHDGFLIPVSEFVKDTGACRTIQNAWQRHDTIKDCLRQVVPQMKARAMTNFELLAELLA